MKPRYILPLFFLFLSGASPPLGAQSPLPVISRLDSRDLIFRQYLQDVEAGRRLVFSSRLAPEELAAYLTIYSYIPKDGDDLLAVAARCNIPYAALASLNRFTHKEDLAEGKPVLLPSVPGIFVPEQPETDLESLMVSSRGQEGVLLSVPRRGKSERFRFVPGGDFSPAERIFFLNRGFHLPLSRFRITSLFGPRIDPITGNPGNHRGIDLAAPTGTEVFAVRDGTVMDIGETPVLGKYIILDHGNNWLSLYGHLSSVDTVLRAELHSGSLIGRVGSTGQSTGPHLHFELIQNGEKRDPAGLLGLFKGITKQ